jgi:hypothetical protein
MSLLKSNSVQIGQSATATQNFTLSVPSSPDGTIKLARGNSGATTADVLTVDASGVVTATLSTSSIPNASITAPKLNGAQSGSAPIFGARAWCRFNGTTTGTNAPTAGGNVSTVARTSNGVYTITFATAMQDANYCVQITSTALTAVNALNYVNSTSASSCVVAHAESNTATDATQMHIAIFR